MAKPVMNTVAVVVKMKISMAINLVAGTGFEPAAFG